MLKRLTVSILFLALISSVLADFADAKAKSARKRKGKKTIICGPKADDAAGVVSLAEAIKKLKKESVLRLQPGNYGDGIVEIKTSKLLIEGTNPEELCQLNLLLTGKECVVRNVYLKSLITPNTVVIVDARFKEVTLRSDWKKADQVLYNCCMNHIYVNPALKKVYIKNVTAAHGKYGIEMGEMKDPKKGSLLKGQLFIGNSVICGDEGAVFLERPTLDNLESTFSNCILKGGKTLFLYGVGKNEYPRLKALTIRFGKYKQKGKIFVADPKFEDPKGFVLSKESKGFKKKWGVKLNDKMVPIP